MRRACRVLLGIAIIIFARVAMTNGQTLEAKISVALHPGTIHIQARFPAETRTVSFINAYGSMLGLAERIEKLQAFAESGQEIGVKQLAPGEYQLASQVRRLEYDVNLHQLPAPAQRSHVSWLTVDHGLLMASDLLPWPVKGATSFSAAEIELDLPAGWKVASNTQTRSANIYYTDAPETALFFVGADLHEETRQAGAQHFSVVLSGAWPFLPKDALKIAKNILEAYARLSAFSLKRPALLMLAPFPDNAGPERWTAETRGGAIVLLLGRNASAKRILAQLAVVLAHEVFHLWVPGSLNLSGDYDWFFEGFTIYQALRMDLRLGLISFEEFMKTVGRVYDSYLRVKNSDDLSLIEASARRWTTSSSPVYDKAMLVAFLYDLRLRSASNCKGSLDDVYRQLFQRRTAGQADGNETIIGILNAQSAQGTFARDYIERPRQLDLKAELVEFGFDVRQTFSGTSIALNSETKAQKKLMRCVAWQK